MFIIFVILLFALVVLPYLIPLKKSATDPAALADEDGQFIEVDGLRLYVRDTGPRDGQTIVFIHGLFGSTFSWRYNVPALNAAGYRTIAIDRPGAGLSDKPFDYNYEHREQARLITQVMDRLNVQHGVIIGHSAGGNVAAHVALAYPERTEKLVLADGALEILGPPSFVVKIIMLPFVLRWIRIIVRRVFTRQRLEKALSRFYADPSFPTQADYDGYWRTFQTANWEAGLLLSVKSFADNRLSDDQLRSIQTPTLLIWGEADTVVSLEQAHHLHNLLPHANLISYPHVGHQSMEEAADLFNEDLLAFLREKD